MCTFTSLIRGGLLTFYILLINAGNDSDKDVEAGICRHSCLSVLEVGCYGFARRFVPYPYLLIFMLNLYIAIANYRQHFLIYFSHNHSHASCIHQTTHAPPLNSLTLCSPPQACPQYFRFPSIPRLPHSLTPISQHPFPSPASSSVPKHPIPPSVS